jgi:hypothetical protein
VGRHYWGSHTTQCNAIECVRCGPSTLGPQNPFLGCAVLRRLERHSHMLQGPRAVSTSAAGRCQAARPVSPLLQLGQYAAWSRLNGPRRLVVLRAADQDIYGKLKDKLYMEAAAKRFAIGEQRQRAIPACQDRMDLSLPSNVPLCLFRHGRRPNCRRDGRARDEGTA